MKNLEEEYKNSQKEEMPDLWNRIEAGLPEKKKTVFFMSANRYLGIAAAAAALLLIVSAGLWSGRQLSKNNNSNISMDMNMQNGAAAALMDNAGGVYENEDSFGAEANEEVMWAEEAEDYEMEEGSWQQSSEQNGTSHSPIMQDSDLESTVQEDISESAGSGNAQTAVGGMPVEDAETGKTTALSEKEALALLGVYLAETGVLPPEKEAYGTGEGEIPGYAWRGISEKDGEPVHMFLEFYSLDGSYLLFKMGERTENGETAAIYRTYSVHTLTGAIAEE